MKLTSLFLLFFLVFSLHAQKHDYIWYFGQDWNLDVDGVQNTMFDFNKRPLEPEERNGFLQFDQNNAVYCDENGKMLCYTNGCAVVNAENRIMPNGDSINYTQWFDNHWFEGSCKGGYPGRQDILILPDAANQFGLYLFSKPNDLDEDGSRLRIHIPRILTSYIDLEKDNGLGDVTSKNDSLYEGKLMGSYLTSISHSDQNSWWITNPDTFSRILVFLLDENGIELVDSTQYGHTTPFFSSAGGEAKFSPDGTKYAYFNAVDGFRLYDFDRSTGKFSGPETVSYNFDPPRVIFTTLEWSPNSRFIYYSDGISLWQLDTWADNLEESRILIDNYNGTLDPTPTTFFTSALGPDCKIYIRGGSSAWSMHVIHFPDELGQDCEFVQNGLRLPYLTSTGGFPNVPRYRVDAELKCDSTIMTLFGTDIYWRRDLDIFPNPASDRLTIELPQDIGKGLLYMMDMSGRRVWEQETALEEDVLLDLDGFTEGTYLMEFVPLSNDENRLWSSKVVVVK